MNEHVMTGSDVTPTGIRAFLSHEDLAVYGDGLDWATLKTLLIAKGVPAERLEGRPDYRADLTETGLLVEFP